MQQTLINKTNMQEELMPGEYPGIRNERKIENFGSARSCRLNRMTEKHRSENRQTKKRRRQSVSDFFTNPKKYAAAPLPFKSIDLKYLFTPGAEAPACIFI